MHRTRDIVCMLLMASICLSHASSSVAANDSRATPEEVFKSKGLTKIGFLLVSEDEAIIRTTANSVRSLKTKVTAEALTRASTARAVQSAQDAYVKIEADLTSMHEQMESMKGNPTEYNRRVAPFNATLTLSQQRLAALKDLIKKQEGLENSQPAYADAVIESAQMADEATADYAKLANDAALTAAIAAYNAASSKPVKLGPTGTCLADITYLKKCIADMEADGVPVQMSGGVPVLEVTINGKKRQMLWDSGAAPISLSAETAAELGLHVTDKDRTIPTLVADGRTVNCKLIVIPEVRVGPFSAQNIEAVIHPPGKTRGDDLLGGAFQSHFKARLDQEAGVLHLTPISEGAHQPVAETAAPAPTGGDIYARNGLTIVGDVLVSSQETEIHTAVLSLRGLQSKVASEASARAGISRAVQNTTDALVKIGSDQKNIEDQIGKAKEKSVEYFNLVEALHATYKQVDQHEATLDDLKKKLGKMQDSQSSYTESAIAAAQKVDAALDRYAALAADVALKAEIDKYNKGAAKPIALGPSASFARDVDFLKKAIDEIISDGVPTRMKNGVPIVEVLINGKSLDMVWDSGAAYVSFSAETAAELGLHATDADETITLYVADGRPVHVKLIVVPFIDVGGFVAHNVKCTIDPPGAERSPDLLGETFQAQFLCRLDQQASLLHLTPNDKKSVRTIRPAAAPAGPDAKSPSLAAPTAPPAAPPTNTQPPEAAPVRTESAGGNGGGPFEDLAPRKSILIGFTWVTGDYAGHKVLDGVEPIFMSSDGKRVTGHRHGRQDGNPEFVVAKPGYAVGGIVARSGDRLDGFKVIFMRRVGDHLDPKDSYESNPIGGEGGSEHTLAGDGKVVIGIFGKSGGQMDAIGLIEQP